jgi:hypothetical protein
MVGNQRPGLDRLLRRPGHRRFGAALAFRPSGAAREQASLSPRFIWMAAKETVAFRARPTTFIEAGGTGLKAALDIARNYGCVEDKVLPFGSGKLFPDESAPFYAIASQLKLTSYINLGRNLGHWRRWIATKGPILTRLDCDNHWMNAASTNGRLDVYDAMSMQGGHVVAGRLRSEPVQCAIAGARPGGDEGFAYASNAYAAAAFTEAYGVSVI